MDASVLYLIFNRPDLTMESFNAIRVAKPNRLFIAADGPRNAVVGEMANCLAARQVTESIDWDCDVYRLYNEQNMGCRKAVSRAITWFFDHVDEGIVLEDDCLPVPEFFPYCEELLERFRDDERIYMISGSRQSVAYGCTDSYALSRWGSVWGWASWKRAWQHYDVDMMSWHSWRGKLLHAVALKSLPNFLWRYSVYQSGDCRDTWDFQWTYTRQQRGGLTVIPKYSLINNIGFDNRATHTTTGADLFCPESALEIPLLHPSRVRIDKSHDRELEKKSRHFSRDFLLPRLYGTYEQLASSIERRFQRA